MNGDLNEVGRNTTEKFFLPGGVRFINKEFTDSSFHTEGNKGMV